MTSEECFNCQADTYGSMLLCPKDVDLVSTRACAASALAPSWWNTVPLEIKLCRTCDSSTELEKQSHSSWLFVEATGINFLTWSPLLMVSVWQLYLESSYPLRNSIGPSLLDTPSGHCLWVLVLPSVEDCDLNCDIKY